MPEFGLEDIGSFLRKRVETFSTSPKIYEYGLVTYSGDGVVTVDGLPNVRSGELLRFENDVYGMAMDLFENGVGAVTFGQMDNVSVGSQVFSLNRMVESPQGDVLLGRVIDPIGRPLDGKQLICDEYVPIERPSPSIIQRKPVNVPLQTGILTIDSMIPIGRGQRELIIGDRQTGKTSIALDAILNQKDTGVICVYCAIGQKASSIAQVVKVLEDAGAMDYSVVVASTASDGPAMQYIAPYAACSVAEGFMYAGRDVLIVYDDLSKHAVAYRTISLLLRRPPGREAYPGDVFYLHSRLLERAVRLSDDLGGGSMTALPIIETMAGDITSYIPTNVISITDGQIYLETELFHSGMRPAINVGLSVSRVGRSAQRPAMKKLSGSLRLYLAQYRELAVFTQFGADIDASTRTMLQRGQRLTETIKQDKQRPLKLSEQVTLLIAFESGVLDAVPVEKVGDFNQRLLAQVNQDCSRELAMIDRTGELEDGVREVLTKKVYDFAEAEGAVDLNAEHK